MLIKSQGANLTRNPLVALYNERLDCWDKIDRLTADGHYARANSLWDYVTYYLDPLIKSRTGL